MMNSYQLIANRFEIHDLLGRGGMGEVYRATDMQTGETVAVKALNPEILKSDPTLLERFVREGEALRQLNHPNIVHMISAVEEGGRHYLTMEFVEGGSLRDLLNSCGSLPANDAIKIGLEVADALTRAHHLKIIHRDLKPANVLLAKDGTPRLADFGIAYIEDSSQLTQSGVLIGTVDYLSPEVCQGDPPNELSDIWAFGVLLFEMLSGKLPFEGKNLTAKITSILTQHVPDLSHLAPNAPDALVDLIYRMLEKDPQQRIPSVRMVGAELESIQKGRERAGKVTSKLATSPELPAFLEEGVDVEQPVFVTREGELAQLDRFLTHTLEGRGQVAFIMGDPGQGKTALTQEFARQAREKYPDLVIASGNCNAYTGIGDPYLPFREILGLLCGDIESRWEAHAINREQARRLWQCIPLVVLALVESGRDLVDIFISGDTLIRRAAVFPTSREQREWLPKLEKLLQYKAAKPADPNFQQAALFEQYTRVLKAIANQKPLLLILDDLQWADSASINLLFHLGKRIEGSRIMILGTSRSTELALGRDGQRHPLEPILNEFKRQFGEIQIELGRTDGRHFVDAYLDSEPNRLNENFRATLFRLAEGQPLGTIELLQDMKERGGLVRDSAGYWVEGLSLNWETLPARVEGMIAERIERLADDEQQILKIASVEGETFTAEIIAKVLRVEEREIVGLLSNVLDKKHRLVAAQNIRVVNGKRLSTYRFRHILFQRYLYGDLDAVERSHLHQEMGTVLQGLYGEDTEEIAIQLAHHFQEAGTIVKAADYLDRAGDRASEFVAHEEAIEHYQQAISAYRKTFGDHWDPLQQAVLERKIGEAFYRRGEHEEAIKHFDLALSHLGHSLPKSRWGIRLAILGETLRQIGHRSMPRLFTRPISKEVVPSVVEAGQSYEPLGWITVQIHQELFLLITLKSLNQAERAGYGHGIAVYSAGLGAILHEFSLDKIARRYHDRSIQIAEQTHDMAALGLACLTAGIGEAAMGNFKDADEYFARSAEVSKTAGDLRSWGQATNWCIGELIDYGKSAEALELCQVLLHAGEESADRTLECWALSKKGAAVWHLGQLEEAKAIVQACIELADSIPDYSFRIGAGSDMGRILVRQGKLDEALIELDQTYKLCLEHPEGFGMMENLSIALAEAYLAMAEGSTGSERRSWLVKSKRLCDDALRLSNKAHYIRTEAYIVKGKFEMLMGNKTSAAKWWQRAISTAEEYGFLYDLGLSHLEYGKQFNDGTHLELAIEIFSEINAQWDLEQAQQTLEKL